MPPTLEFFFHFFGFFFLTLFDHIWPFWTILATRKKSVKSDVKKFLDPHRKDKRHSFRVKKIVPRLFKKSWKKSLLRSMLCHDTVWYDMIWYGMVWYDMIWYGMVWYDMIWYDMICFDLIWFDMIWYDMIWYFIVQFITLNLTITKIQYNII